MSTAKSRRRPAELTGPEAEIERLRAIFWEILQASGTDLRGYRKMPRPGEHSPDIPEWALETVEGLRAEMAEYTGMSGADINDDAGPDEVCACGEVITWYRRTWQHLFSSTLRRYGSHSAQPSTGFYNPDERAARAERERDGTTAAETIAEAARRLDEAGRGVARQTRLAGNQPVNLTYDEYLRLAEPGWSTTANVPPARGQWQTIQGSTGVQYHPGEYDIPVTPARRRLADYIENDAPFDDPQEEEDG